ncbi:MAG TPA: hypothetical protein VGB28_08835 [Actinomycetota bacterium]
MPRKRKRPPRDPYSRVRKPVPPPGKVIPDRRREIREDQARKEAEDPEEDR